MLIAAPTERRTIFAEPAGVYPTCTDRRQFLSGRRMRLLPEGIDEMSANFRWGVEWRLRMIEDVVCAPQGSRPEHS